MSRSEHDIILEALDHLAIMRDHQRRGALDDAVILDAICLRLASAIKSLSRLPAERLEALFGAEWHAMWSTRNRIAHGYVRIDPSIIAATLRQNVPRMTRILSDEIGEDR